MSRFLYLLGRACAAHPWRTLVAWAVVAGAVLSLGSGLGGEPRDDYDVPEARAQVGIDQLREHLPAAGYTSAQVVVHDPDGAAPSRAALADLTRRLTAMPHVLTVSEPRSSPDRDTVLLDVAYDAPITHPDLMENLAPLEEAVAPTVATGLEVELGGELPGTGAAPMKGYGELIGVVSALVILVLAFGSVVGAGLPIAVALTGLTVASGGVLVLAATMDVSTAAPMVASMVGLGVGIDYALLIATRHGEYLRDGHPVAEAAGRAVATAGRSVVFAAATVLVSLMGLRLSGLPVYASFGFATAITVVAVMAAAVTLVPALCRFAGRRLLPRRERRGRARRTPLTARWAERVGRTPLPWAVGAALVMVLLALPVLDMRTWPQDPSSQAPDLSSRQAYDLVAEEFGPGFNGPFTIVVDREQVGDAETATLARTLGERDGVVAVTPANVSPDGALSVFSVVPAFGPTDERTPDLVDDVRRAVPEGVEVTGSSPMFADIAELLATRLWLVIGFVVTLSFLLLALVFRSVVVPLKAAVMNLLSIGAAYGVVTAVFQWGWGAGLLGLDHAVPVSSWMPMLMFTILFGLSMDYEVFLLSRVKEDYEATGDARGSVVRGLASTGTVISCAAAIMVAVFLGFATEVDVLLKMLGLGMASAILLDATVVRMVLVPATMSLLGRANWWLPSWLDRLLPGVRAELTEADLAGLVDPERELVGAP
ncbi:MMPL family transporter [Nocardioides sp.]|uniref:MMPL family transporter n=1 Tax=Nocardioides sp. TaxID=35761 RepID=UPI0035ADF550